MKNFLTKLAVVGVLLSPVALFADSAKKLMVVVTSGDSMTQLMSLVLSAESKAKGANVNILLCSKAGDLAIKGSKEERLKPKDVSAQMLLKKLIKSGTEVGVCPLYLPNSTKTKADLIDGVAVVSPANMAEFLLEKDRKILSY